MAYRFDTKAAIKTIVEKILQLKRKENWVEIKQLVKILKFFISAIKYIKGNINNYGVKGLYRAL